MPRLAEMVGSPDMVVPLWRVETMVTDSSSSNREEGVVVPDTTPRPSWAPDLAAQSSPVLTGEVIDPPRHGGGRPNSLDQWHSDVESRPARTVNGRQIAAVEARTVTRREALLDALRSGLPISAACEYAGVSEDVYYAERNRNSEFRDQVARVRRRSHLVALSQLQQAATDDWRAADRWLQLSDPNLFGDRLNIKSTQRVEIVTVILTAMQEAIDLVIPDPAIRLRLAEAVSDGVASAMGDPREGAARPEIGTPNTAIDPGNVGGGDQPGEVEAR